MKWLRALGVAVFCVVATNAGAWWQSIQQVAVSGAASYQGPGDVYSTAHMWGSTARAYSLAYANGTNPMADLVDATTGSVAICTLRVATTGFVDLTGSYCTGSATPAVACAAAAGGQCKVTKLYDQSGNGRDLTQVTASAMPLLTFGAINGLPGMTFGGASVLLQSATFTLAQPFTLSVVFKRTSGTTLSGLLVNSGAQTGLFASATGGQAALLATTEVDAAATENTWHGFVGLASGSGNNCATNLDSSDTASLNCGTSGFVAQGYRIGRSSGGVQLTGIVAEVGGWAKTSNATDRGNVYTNQHGASGYAGAF